MAKTIEQAVLDLQQTVHHQVAALAALQQQPAPVVNVQQARAPSVPTPRIPPPPFFDGRAAALDDWLAAMRQQFGFYAGAMPSDAERIMYATA